MAEDATLETPPATPAVGANSVTGGASHRSINSMMDNFFDIQRPQAPKVGTVGQEPRWPGQQATDDDGAPVVTKGAPLPEDDLESDTNKQRVGGQTSKAPSAVADAAAGTPPSQTDDDLVGDPELDAIQLRPNVHPKTKGEFRQLKVVTKDYKDKFFGATKELETLRAENAQLKAGGAASSDPQLQARVQKAEEIIRAARLPESKEYQEKFQQPIGQKWQRVVDDLADILSKGRNRNDPQLVEFHKQLIDLGPDAPALDKQWWNEQINKLGDEDDKLDLRAQLRDITVLRRERDRFVREQGSDPDRFQKFQQAEWDAYQKQYNNEVVQAINSFKEELGVSDLVSPKRVEDAKNDEERKAIEAHNKRFQDNSEIFMRAISDIFAPEVDEKGVRRSARHARVATLVVKAHHLEGVNKELTTQLDAERKRVSALEAQVKRSAGASARMERNGGAPTHKPQSQPQQVRGNNTRDRAANAMNDYMREKGHLRE